jgi:hypothetical protein
MRATLGASSIDCTFLLANLEFSCPLASYGLTIEGFIEAEEIFVSQDSRQFVLSLAHRKIHRPAHLEFEDRLLSMIPPVFLGWLQETKISSHWSFLLPLCPG